MSTLPGGLSGLLGGATAYAIGHTAGDIINRAAKLSGLAAVADPYASTDANFIRLCALLTDVGQEVAKLRPWTHLQKEYAFTTTADVDSYDLPADFRGMIDQTGWNRTGRTMMGGPLSPQEWQYLQGVGAGASVTVLFRPLQQKLYLYMGGTVPADYSIAFEYQSTYWVQPEGESEGTQAEPTASSDVVLFDPLLMVRALRLAFLKATGFDTSAAEADYESALYLVSSDDAAAPVLGLSAGTGNGFLLGARNLPPGNWGS